MSPTPPKRRTGSAAAAKATPVQDRPAAKAQPKADKAPVLDPNNRDGEFLPNPTAAPRQGRPEPVKRQLRVVGPKEVGGVRAPGWLEMDLTDAQLDALLAGGHVEDWDGVEGWGSEDAPEPEPEADAPPADPQAEPEPKDEPKAGAEKEGN